MQTYEMYFNQNGARIYFDADDNVEARRNAASKLPIMVKDKSGVLTNRNTGETWLLSVFCEKTANTAHRAIEPNAEVEKQELKEILTDALLTSGYGVTPDQWLNDEMRYSVPAWVFKAQDAIERMAR